MERSSSPTRRRHRDAAHPVDKRVPNKLNDKLHALTLSLIGGLSRAPIHLRVSIPHQVSFLYSHPCLTFPQVAEQRVHSEAFHRPQTCPRQGWVRAGADRRRQARSRSRRFERRSIQTTARVCSPSPHSREHWGRGDRVAAQPGTLGTEGPGHRTSGNIGDGGTESPHSRQQTQYKGTHRCL